MFKKLLVTLVVLIILAAILIGFAPMLLSAGPAASFMSSAISERINGTAVVKKVSLSWSGPQRVTGFTIDDAQGKRVVEIDADLASGLIALLSGGSDPLPVRLSGSVRSALAEDGSLSLAELPRDDPAQKTPGSGGTPAKGPAFAGVPALDLVIDGLTVKLDIEGADTPTVLTMEGATGALQFAPGGPLVMKLDTKVTSSDDARVGSLAVDATVKNAVDARGNFTPKGATVTATVKGRSLLVPFAREVDEIVSLDVAVDSADLAEALALEFNLQTALRDADPSGLIGDLRVVRPFGPDGAMLVGLDSIAGTVRGERVPTALLQTALADTPIVLARDIGATADINATFPEPGAGGAIDVVVTSDRLEGRLAGTVGAGGAITGAPSRLTWRTTPELLAGFLPADAQMTVKTAPTAVVDLTGFTVPARDADGNIALGAISAAGTLTINGLAVQAGANADAPALDVDGLKLACDFPTLAEAGTLTGGGTVAGGALAVDLALPALVGADGAFAFDAAGLRGTASLTEFDPQRAIAMFDLGLPASLLAGPVGVTAQLGTETAADVFRLGLTGPVAEGTVTGKRDGAVWTIAGDGMNLVARLSPEMVADLQPDAESPVGFGRRIVVNVGATEPIRFDPAAEGMPRVALRATSTFIVLTHAALDKPLGIDELALPIVIDAEGMTISGGAAKLALRTGEAIAAVTFEAQLPKTEGETASIPTGKVRLAGIDVARLETVLGMDAGTIADWTGPNGALVVDVTSAGTGRAVALRPEFPRAKGTLTASLVDDVLAVDAGAIDLTVAPGALERILNRHAEGKAVPVGGNVVIVKKDVPMRLAIKRVNLPLALLRGEAIDPSTAALDVVVSGGPLSVAGQKGVGGSIQDLVLRLAAPKLSEGIALELTSKVVHDLGGSAAGGLNLKGTLTQLFDDERKLAMAGAHITATGGASKLPTILLDGLLDLDRLLVDAAGPMVDASVAARDFSFDSGSVDLDINVGTGFLKGRLDGRNQTLVVSGDNVNGQLELTESLRQRFLAKVHPFLADIRTVENPIRFVLLENATLPLDGDLSRLDADFRIEVGAVEFDAGSTTLGIFQFFAAASQTATRPGYIDPIVGTIRKGVLRYQSFSMKLDKYTLKYEGSVDLVKEKLELRTTIPLDGLAKSFHDLEGYVEGIEVPLVTRGGFAKPKTEIDPNFDLAGAVLKKGVGDLINDGIKSLLDKDKDKE